MRGYVERNYKIYIMHEIEGYAIAYLARVFELSHPRIISIIQREKEKILNAEIDKIKRRGQSLNHPLQVTPRRGQAT